MRMEPSIPSLNRIQAGSPPSRVEISSLALSLALFLCLGVLVSARYPFVWLDEVAVADPAINFVSGRGFTSTAWYAQPSGEFWAGNVPMYHFLLVPWLKCFGISITSVRSISFLYLSLFVCLSMVGGTRLGLLCDRTSRSCFLGALIAGYGMICSYGSARYDSLGMVLVGAYVFLYSVKRRWIRLAGFLLVGCLVPWTGLQLLQFEAVTGVLIWLYVGRRFFPLLVAAGSGSVVGLVTLSSFFWCHGVLDRFIHSIRSQNAFGSFIRGLLSGVIRHQNFLPKDLSLFSMFLGAGIVLVLLHQEHKKSVLRSPLFVGSVIALSVSFALVLSWKFPTFYSWMAYLPILFGISHAIGTSNRGTLVRRIGVATCIVSGSIGVSVHALNLFGCWNDRSYSNVERLVSQAVHPEERVYAEYAAYYALHPITKSAYYPQYLAIMNDVEKAGVDVLIVYPHNLADATRAIGGLWEATGQQFTPRSDGLFGSQWELGYLSLPNYGLAVYRRAKAPVQKAEARARE
jgi:hypothetical protein